MGIRNAVTAAILVLALSACATGASKDQAEAGLTRVETEWCGTGEQRHLCALEFTDGKDKKSGKMSVKHPNGLTVDYEANDVTGLDAIQARAAVEKALAEAGASVIPGVVDALVKGITGR